MNELSRRLYKAMEAPTIGRSRQSLSLHPSAASVVYQHPKRGRTVVGTCIRQEYYRMTGAKGVKVVNPDWDISALAGDKMQELLEDLLLRHGFQMGIQPLAREHRIYQQDLGLSGRTDILVWDYHNKHMAGIDAKSLGEWKSGKVLQMPDEEHVMQCAIYLDYYQKEIPEGQARPEFWYIWYFARSENYHVKKKKHGSPFTQIWDFAVSLDEGTPIVYGSNQQERWDHLHIDKIYQRYEALLKHVAEARIPDRDYQHTYSEDYILWLHRQGLLEYKKYREPVEKWIKEGAPKGQLNLDMGDIQCRRFCEFANECWNLGEQILQDSSQFNLPKAEEPETEKTGDGAFCL